MDWTALSLTLKLALWTIVFLAPVAVVVARWLATTQSRWRPWVSTVVLLPLVLPPTVLGYYLLVGLSPQGAIGGFVSRFTGTQFVFSFPAIVVASILVNIPFAVAPMQRAFEAVPRNVREAAWVSGLSVFDTFRHVEFPLAWPGLVSAVALVAAHTFGEFGVLLMVGGNIPGETRTLSIAIYDAVQAFRNAEAAVMAFALLTVSFGTLLAMHFTEKRPGSHG